MQQHLPKRRISSKHLFFLSAVADRTEQEKETTQEAIMNMAHAQEKQKESYSLRRPMDQPLYDTDTLVLIKRHVTGKGKGVC